MSETYIDRVLEGSTLWTDIDDYVGRWHDDPKGELHEFLGFAWEEYALWVEQPRALRLIIASHERGEPVTELLAHADEAAVAARGLSDQDVRIVREWLQETGRLQKD